MNRALTALRPKGLVVPALVAGLVCTGVAASYAVDENSDNWGHGGAYCYANPAGQENTTRKHIVFNGGSPAAHEIWWITTEETWDPATGGYTPGQPDEGKKRIIGSTIGNQVAYMNAPDANGACQDLAGLPYGAWA